MKTWLSRLGSLLILAPGVWACPFCNIDGPAVRVFIVTVMGSAILGAVFVFVWAWASGQYDNVEAPKYRILEIDEETSVNLGPDGGQKEQIP